MKKQIVRDQYVFSCLILKNMEVSDITKHVCLDGMSFYVGSR